MKTVQGFSVFENYTETSEPIALPARIEGGQTVTLSIYPQQSGSAKWQYTTFPDATDGTPGYSHPNAEWLDWDLGLVTAASVSALATRATYVKLYVTAAKTGSITAFADYSGTVTGAVLVTDVAHGLLTGDVVLIAGTTNYNGSYTITKVTADTFYIIAAWDDGTATWTLAPGTITAYADYSGTVAGTVLATSVAHGLVSTDEVTITGSTSYDATYTITVVDVDTFYFTATWATDTAAGTWQLTPATIASFADYSGTVAGTVLATDVAHGILSGVVTISGSVRYNGTYTVTVVDVDTFYFTAVFVALDSTGTWGGGAEHEAGVLI